MSSWQLQYILQQIWILTDQTSEVIISYTLGEGIKVTDCLSNLGCDGITNFTLQPTIIIEQYKDLHMLITHELVDCQG